MTTKNVEMIGNMLTVILKKIEVLYSIIRSYSVNMVNNFISFQFSSSKRFDNSPVLPDVVPPLSFVQIARITIFCGNYSTLPMFRLFPGFVFSKATSVTIKTFSSFYNIKLYISYLSTVLTRYVFTSSAAFIRAVFSAFLNYSRFCIKRFLTNYTLNIFPSLPTLSRTVLSSANIQTIREKFEFFFTGNASSYHIKKLYMGKIHYLTQKTQWQT